MLLDCSYPRPLFDLYDDGKRRRRIDLLLESIVFMIGCLGSQGVGGYVSLWARTLIWAVPAFLTVVLASCLRRTHSTYCGSDGVTANFWGVLVFFCLLSRYRLHPMRMHGKEGGVAFALSLMDRHSFDFQA